MVGEKSLLHPLCPFQAPRVALKYRSDAIVERACLSMSGIGLFIDGASPSIAWRLLSTSQVDFAALRHCIEERCEDRIIEAYCFDATENGCTNAYFAAMQRCGIRVKLYERAYEDVYDANRQRITDSHGMPVKRQIQKGVDVGLVTHMLVSYRRKGWRRLVLLAADADFAEPVQRLVEQEDVSVTLLGVPERVSHKLKAYASDMIDLRQIRHSIERREATMLRATA